MVGGMDPTERPAAVIFDLDGTLVDTVPTRIAAWTRAFEEHGVAATAAQVAPLIGADGRMLARRVAGEAGAELDEQAADALDARSGEIYSELNTEPRPLEGVAEALAMLEARGIPWAIATSSRREQVETSVAALGLADEPTVVDGSHVEHAKPAPDLLLLAARQLRVPPDRCWYVGDSTWDMEASSAAEMLPIAVVAGAAVDGARLQAAGARIVLATLDELMHHLPD